jgi:hypothetical protein
MFLSVINVANFDYALVRHTSDPKVGRGIFILPPLEMQGCFRSSLVMLNNSMSCLTYVRCGEIGFEWCINMYKNYRRRL